MRIGLSMRSERAFASVEWDSTNPRRWRPAEEHGAEKWGRHIGARWLGFSFVAQRFTR